MLVEINFSEFCDKLGKFTYEGKQALWDHHADSWVPVCIADIAISWCEYTSEEEALAAYRVESLEDLPEFYLVTSSGTVLVQQ